MIFFDFCSERLVALYQLWHVRPASGESASRGVQPRDPGVIHRKNGKNPGPRPGSHQLAAKWAATVSQCYFPDPLAAAAANSWTLTIALSAVVFAHSASLGVA